MPSQARGPAQRGHLRRIRPTQHRPNLGQNEGPGPGTRERLLRAVLSANRELVLLYWGIGLDIIVRQAQQGWGAGVIDRLSRDLRHEFPDMKRFSPSNLRYMKAFAEAWPDEPFVQQAAAKLPWFHLCTVLDRVPGLSSASAPSTYHVSGPLPDRTCELP